MKHKSSTAQDIRDNITELTMIASSLMKQHTNESDWWQNITIDDKDFDINIFDWELEDNTPVRIATAHPVIHDGSGFAETDMTNHVRLVEHYHGRDLGSLPKVRKEINR